jgi:hypothetical protein
MRAMAFWHYVVGGVIRRVGSPYCGVCVRLRRSVAVIRETDVLSVDGCASWQRALTGLGTARAGCGRDATVRLSDVTTMAPEELAGFASSPTIRVDGVDLFGYVGPSVMACCRYKNSGQGWPSLETLTSLLNAALMPGASLAQTLLGRGCVKSARPAGVTRR